MGLSNSISVRFSDETKGRLQRIADRSGLDVADLVRLAIDQMLDRAEETGQIGLVLKEERTAYGKKAANAKNSRNP